MIGTERIDESAYRPLVSVLIGAYNVENYLREKRLSCVLSQTYNNLEIVIVDDGSTDGTFSALNGLATIDKRIKIIHKENGGLGSARNAGLDEAQGEFVWFYDVDDEADLNLVEKNIELMRNDGVDLIVFGFHAITPSINQSEDIRFKEHLITSSKELRDAYVDELLFVRNGNGFAWNKFYRRSFIEENHLRFDNQRIRQDEVFNLKVYEKISRVYISPDVLYHYYIYDKGNNRSHFILDRFDIFMSIRDKFIELKNHWELEDKRFDTYLLNKLWGDVMACITYNAFHPECPWGKKERKMEFDRILETPCVKECLNTYEPQNIEQKLYLHAFRRHSYTMMNLIRRIFKCMRCIKHSI